MNLQTTSRNEHKDVQLSQKVTGKPLRIGEGFEAMSFKHDQFDGLMDPLVMIDHYTMSRPTFGAHPHAGMSALSILFEDSEGVFNNRDSLGNNIDLLPGDAYWLKAGSGAVHDEKPTQGSRTHGLQIFVNLPQRHKHDAPTSRHVPSTAIPVIASEGHRVRVVLGDSNGTQGPQSPALPLTALDAFLDAGGTYTHDVNADQSLLVYSVHGEVTVQLGEQEIHLPEKQAIAMQSGARAQTLNLASAKGAHLVVLQGAPVREQFIQKGPFVMSTTADIQQVTAAYEAGQLGAIAE
ncbi:pirin family protein [Spongiibacter nanhainus]|uniref:Pirin family protein n=1 Tax=Spongiibacter nanhainus TaxID=2794344 RepID=A0A7T4UQM6_9GAMM|nr:pirin-like C-terminal cupin domain-containing protein [Spongiibacter nanhainus]QQD17465.1 pirin family protein [Spongiibacter nanhainus]